MSKTGEITKELGSPCPCSAETSPVESAVTECEKWCCCPRDKHDIVIHEPNCKLFKSETFIFPEDVCECDIRQEIKKTGRNVCECKLPEGVKEPDGIPCECDLPEDVRVERHVCKCEVPEGAKEALDEWRKKRNVGAMPAVLEASHPLMQRFQQTLREFLLKENAIAAEEILNLKDDILLSKLAYEKDLEDIYKNDHDCNAQRTVIEEYEATLTERTTARQTAELNAKQASKRQKLAREQLDQDLVAEREVREEMEVLTVLCKQLEKWREDTESDLTVSQHMSVKMRTEKRLLAVEKREMDIIIFGLSNEVWKLDSKLEMMRKQMEIKSFEMEKINDKVTAYGAELEDLELDKRRLVSLWNSILNNISQRDNIFDSVREDSMQLQKKFHTLINNLEVTKKAIADEMSKGKELAMAKEKIIYDTDKVIKLFNTDDNKRITLETDIGQVTESIDITDKDLELMKTDNFTKRNILNSSEKEFDHKINKKLKFECEILTNLQECLLNNKAVESMANGIKHMREMSRKQEISLLAMETQHAKLVLDLETLRYRREQNEKTLKENLATVRQKEKKLKEQEQKHDKRVLITMRKQRELDTVTSKYFTLKEIFEAKTAQELRIEALETQIKSTRERTYYLQHDWLRMQGHVVKLTEQFQKVITDMNLVKKQLQICEQKCMGIQADGERVIHDKTCVERNLRELRSTLQVLQRTRKEAQERNNFAQSSNISITQEYAVNLKGAEMQVIELEEEIDAMDKEKNNLTQDLDRFQREALIWQRKGILAVELRKNMKEAKSAAGEIGKMRNEIHRMESRREHLRRTGEKLAEDLAHYVKRRETVLEKTRAHAAVEKAHGANHNQVSQSAYHHKLRLAKSDIASVTKQLNDAEASLKQLHEEQKRLECGIDKTKFQTANLEEQIASLMRQCRETVRQKHWLLERVVRSQRLGSELAIVVKRQSLHIKKPKSIVMQEYKSACALIEQIQYVVECLNKEYPNFGDKLSMIANTLEIHSPGCSPRLAESPSICGPIEEVENEDIAEMLVYPQSCLKG